LEPFVFHQTQRTKLEAMVNVSAACAVTSSGAAVCGIAASGRGKSNIHKSVSRSKRAGLVFPVGRIHRYLKATNTASRIGVGAPIFLAASLEYLTAEVLEIAGDAARDNKKSRITPRSIKIAVSNDEELDKLLGGVTIAAGGVLPNIHEVLLPKKGAKRFWTGQKYPSDFYKAKAVFKARGVPLKPMEWRDSFKGKYQKARVQFSRKTHGREELTISRWLEDFLH
jgi:histone H2A